VLKKKRFEVLKCKKCGGEIVFATVEFDDQEPMEGIEICKECLRFKFFDDSK